MLFTLAYVLFIETLANASNLYVSGVKVINHRLNPATMVPVQHNTVLYHIALYV